MIAAPSAHPCVKMYSDLAGNCKSVAEMIHVGKVPVTMCKGFFKDSCGALSRVPDTASNKLKAYKKVIDGLIFPQPRKIFLQLPEGTTIGRCQRPLRAQTAQGERIALATSETVPAGTTIEFSILILDDKLEKLVMELLDYAQLRGLGQWRNSGKGRATYEVIKAE